MIISFIYYVTLSKPPTPKKKHQEKQPDIGFLTE